MERYRLADLVAITGVTQRTIRYYIVEGLLPPPEGAGPAAVYTASHRDRLALIGLLKERYLPLGKIRGELARLTDEQVVTELGRLGATALAGDPATSAPREPTAALDYLDGVLGRGGGAGGRAPAPTPAAFPPLPFPVPRPPAPLPAPARERWERIALAEGVELHVREDRLREAIPLDALVRQARKLLGAL